MSEALVRKHEPVIHYPKGENFYPMGVDPYLPFCSLHHKTKGIILPPTQVTVETLEMFGGDPDYYMVYAAQKVEDQEEYDKLLKFIESQQATRGVKEEIEKLTEKATKLGIKVQRAVLPLDLPKEVHEKALEQYGGIKKQKPTYFYRVSEAGGYQIIQYWFFFAYNDFATAHKGVNDHEADWEQITLFFKGDKPEWAAYASHDASGDELRRKWADIETVGTHPVIYPGIGSHASYFSKGEHHGIDNAPGDGLTVGEGGDHAWEKPADLDKLGWATDYSGLWGYYAHERASDKILGGAVSPAGPKFLKDGTVRKAWENPLAWAELE